jgi:signal transduction histidine kinase
VIMWRVVGRTLLPVESIRAEVEGISNTELHRRVPMPRGRDEIARLAVTMNGMLERLEEGNDRLRRFVSDASHELRSPVAAIRQHAEVALAHPDKTSLDELAAIILQEEARLEQLVDDLLLLARIDEGTFEFRAGPVDLDDIVFDAAGRLRASTRLRIDSTNVSAARISGDGVALDRLVRNLTDNAARHARGVVELALRNGAGEVVFTIDDDGAGIPASERPRIFERFVRLTEARDRDSGGSGLGLAIVAEIASAHGAAVQVLDSPLGGARFEVHFPARDPS